MSGGIGGVGNRLKEALDLRGKSRRALHLALTRKGVPGASYANIRQISLGNTEPSLGFLGAAAAELDVPVAWLAFGHGNKTDSDAVADVGVGRFPAERHAALSARVAGLIAKAPAAAHTAAVIDAFTNAFSSDADARIWYAVSHSWLALSRRFGGGRKGDLRAARVLGSALRAPLDRIGVRPSRLASWQLLHYATLAAAAIDAALAEPHMLRPQTPSTNDTKA